MTLGETDRRTHQIFGLKEEFRETSCARRLQLAWKELRKMGICVVCQKGTKNVKWGVPLCGLGCVQEWMWEEGEYELVNAVIGSRAERIDMRHWQVRRLGP